MSESRSLHVAFIHPDLGIGKNPSSESSNERLLCTIGGAERLVVDAALGLQSLGHSVDIYTSHHNPAHCFDETKDGAYLLQLEPFCGLNVE
jgi:alpha-1,3/alpha-1,6-mannosyltransferase